MEPEVIDLAQAAAIVANLDTPALFVLVLLAGYRQLWVWGHQYRDMVADRDFWRQQALAVVDEEEAT